MGGACEQRKRSQKSDRVKELYLERCEGSNGYGGRAGRGLPQGLVKGPRWGSVISGTRRPAGNFRSRRTKGGATLRQQSAARLDSVLQKPGHLFLARPGLGCVLCSLVIQQTLAARLLFAGL